MNVLRAVRDDLVETRLWPVAVLLVVLMIAIPVVLARGGSAAPAAPAPVPAPVADATAKEPVVLQQPAQPAQAPRGRFRDPFRGAQGTGQPGSAASAAQAGTAKSVTPAPPASSGSSSSSSSSSSSTGSSSSPGGSSSSGGSSQATTVTPSTTPPASAPAAPTTQPAVPGRYFAGYRVDLSWGDPAALRTLHDVDRLTVLRTAARPSLVFLGIRLDGKTAVFLVPGVASATGDGRCRPGNGFCSVIELREGETEYLDVQTPTGVVQAELSLDRVAERRAGTKADAHDALTTAAKAGAKVVSGAIAAGRIFVRRYVYSPARGALAFSTRASQRTLPPAVAPAPAQ